MSSINTSEELKEYHGGFIFGTPSNSKGLNKDGSEYDHAYVTEIGRVEYEIQEDGSYLTTISNTDTKFLEKRILTLDLLSGWFYDPSEEYYNLNIKPIDTI
jgi:hypothetical protein